MSSIPRTASSFLPGIPPIFFKRREKSPRAKPAARVEPRMAAPRAAAPVATVRASAVAPATALAAADRRFS